MSPQELDLSSPHAEGRASRPGWRLRRLEMQNWGTFHWKVHRVIPDAGWSLIVGQNGSGKSTAIDALRTLLVPPRLLRQSYNDAAGESKTGDRTRYSYVRGAWKSQASEAATQGRPEYLRGPGEHSTLLAIFTNEMKDATVTLAQILWLDGDRVNDLFLIALGDRSIADHLAMLGTGTAPEWKRELKRRDWEVRDTFSAYAGRFTGLLGLPGDGALEVFNQAIGVKDVTDINEFIRRHMLEPADSLDFIRDTLQPHYKELNDCWAAIQRAEEQIAALTPIAAAHDRKAAAEVRIGEIHTLQQAAPIYYAGRHRDLLLAQAAELEADLARLEGERSAAQADEQAQRARCLSLDEAIKGSATGQELQRLEREIAFAQRTLTELIRPKHRTWSNQLTALDLSPPADAPAFAAFRSRLEALGEAERLASAEAEESLDDAREALRKAIADETQITDDLQIARERQVAIPAMFLRLRDELCAATSLAAGQIPFAGELMEVKPAYRDWTGAIERVLHGFAISLLVPEAHYAVAARWINDRHLGMRLAFFRIPERGVQLGDMALRAERVAARIDFRVEHPLHRWVSIEVARRFHHVCCEDITALAGADAGVTRAGLVKEAGARHIKDDRHPVDDPRNWVLGWSAERKIKALLAALEDSRIRKATATTALEAARLRKAAIEKRLRALAGLLEIEHFAEVDLDGALEALAAIEADHARLLTADSELKELQRQLEEATQLANEAQGRIESIAGQRGGIEQRQRDNAATQTNVDAMLEPHGDFEPETFAADLGAMETETPTTLANVGKVASDIAKRLQGQASHHTGIVNSANTEMLPLMADFLRDYTEYRGELIAREEYSAEFSVLRARLEHDELPKHKTRFQQLMDESLVGGMAQFSSRLKQHEEDIKQRIELVNGALRTIPFTRESYVQIKPSATSAREIGEFRSRLKACFEGGLRPADADRESILACIRGLMEDFREKEDWTRRVTDARNWMEFGVRELATNGDRELNFLTGSGGRSGGQKAKLAFTILASAITAQYGLAGSPDDPAAFRLVVIDEVFGHTDEEYSRQALDLFVNLGLQLIVVTPFDAKARIVEDYVESFHLTANPERNNSRISRASRAEYQAAWNDVPA